MHSFSYARWKTFRADRGRETIAMAAFVAAAEQQQRVVGKKHSH